MLKKSEPFSDHASGLSNYITSQAINRSKVAHYTPAEAFVFFVMSLAKRLEEAEITWRRGAQKVFGSRTLLFAFVF